MRPPITARMHPKTEEVEVHPVLLTHVAVTRSTLDRVRVTTYAARIMVSTAPARPYVSCGLTGS